MSGNNRLLIQNIKHILKQNIYVLTEANRSIMEQYVVEHLLINASHKIQTLPLPQDSAGRKRISSNLCEAPVWVLPQSLHYIHSSGNE